MIFTEVWIGRDIEAFVIQEYKGYHFPRLNCSESNGARGGCAFYVEAELALFTSEWNAGNSADGRISWLRINAEAGLVEDLYLAACYFPPSDTTAYEQLEADLPIARGRGLVLVAGDFNAHTNEGNGRWSQHKAPTNPSGDCLLELEQATQFSIANGRVPGASSGNYTYWNHSGSKSVLDYFLLCPQLLNAAKELKVSVTPPLERLDHCLLRLKLAALSLGDTPAPPTEPAQLVPMMPPQYRMVYNDEQKAEFVNTMKEIGDSTLPAITAAAAASENAADTAAVLQFFESLWMETLQGVGATKVRTGRARVSCQRTDYRAAARANPEFRRLRRKRNQAKRRRDGDQIRQLDRQISNILQAIQEKLRNQSQSELLKAWKSDLKSFWETFNSGDNPGGHSAAAMFEYCKGLLGGEINEEALNLDQIHIPGHLCADGSILNEELQVEEVVAAIHTLKQNKAVSGPFAVDLIKSVADEKGSMPHCSIQCSS